MMIVPEVLGMLVDGNGLLYLENCCGSVGCGSWELEKGKIALCVLANGAGRRCRLGVYRVGLYRSLQPSPVKRKASCLPWKMAGIADSVD